MLRLLETAARIDGATNTVHDSPFLAYVEECLAPNDARRLVVATVHAIKGQRARPRRFFEAPGTRTPIRARRVVRIRSSWYEPFMPGRPQRIRTSLHGHPGAPTRYRRERLRSFNDQPQEHNLLYIALTRGTESLTFIVNRRTKRIVSPYLPIEMVYYSMDMWNEDAPSGGSDAGGASRDA